MDNRRKHFRHFFAPGKRIGVQISADKSKEVELSSDKRIRVELSSASPSGHLFGRIVNLSLGGMLVQLEDKATQLAIGMKTSASFTLPGNTVPLTMSCEIRRTQDVEGVTCFGCQFLLSENQALKNIQEKVLWQFLSEEQRRQNQMHYEALRVERMQIDRFLSLLNDLVRGHAAVVWAKSNVMNIVYGVLIGVVGATAVAAYLLISNQDVWAEVLKKHNASSYLEGPPDFEKQVTHKDVNPVPASDYDKRKKAADDERDKEIQKRKDDYDNRMKVVMKEYKERSISTFYVVLISVNVLVILSTSVWGFFHWRKPKKIESLQKNLQSRVKVIVDKYPLEVQTWGGPPALENTEAVEKLIATLEEKKARLLES